ncbi:Rv3235 family protein [Rhodococcus phenolicus]|uniref:Rv3235 family protein n=1 Tax=Rhodococcus phenolicus TaxID=263849 RepID=UPI0008312384|nr:Rv3235 family protein [Rhodococcus phenolicus]
MSDTSGSRHVLRIPPYEPPVRHACDRPRRYASRRASAHDGRSPRPARAIPVAVPHSPTVDPTAAAFAERAVRLVLEIVDRRRPDTQLEAVLDPALHDALRQAHTDAGSAILLRTRIRAVDADTAELFGSYTRGHRVFALAGRITRTPPSRRTPHGWLITSLWLG